MKGFGATMKSHEQFHSVPFFSIKFIRGLTVFTKRKIFTQKKKREQNIRKFFQGDISDLTWYAARTI